MVGRASALCPRDCVFDPRPSHTKGLHGNIYYFAWSSALRKKLEIRNGTVLVMIFYFVDTLKVSIELPATFSCRHNMTKYLLEALLNPNKTNKQTTVNDYALRKHAYLNILKILPAKNKNFQIKNSDSFHISAQNIDCRYSLEPPRRGGSNEFPQSMFSIEIRKILYTPVKPSFTFLKWGLRGSKLYRYVFVMV